MRQKVSLSLADKRPAQAGQVEAKTLADATAVAAAAHARLDQSNGYGGNY